MMAPFGMAFPASYSLIIEAFSLICCARAAWNSCDTVACRKVAVFSSSFFAFGTTEWADWLLPPPNFFSVSTSVPARRAAFTSLELLAALPLGTLFSQTTVFQSWSWVVSRVGPLGMFGVRGGAARPPKALPGDETDQ